MFLNVKLGTPTFNMNVPDEYRRCGDAIPYILKQFGVKPVDITLSTRAWQLKIPGGANLDHFKSFLAQGFHLSTLQYGETDENAVDPGIFNPNTNDVKQTVELVDLNDGSFQPPLQTIPLLKFT